MEFPVTVLGAVGWLIGGLGVFLFGIHMLSVGVRDASGEGMRRMIAGVTRFPPVGLLVGALLTGLMQSSSAFSVMVVSFVQAGLLTFRQSIPLILGSAIGSTVTAQLLAKVMGTSILESFSLPLAGVGLLMVLFANRRRTVQVGKILFGFGAVFLGFIFMQGAVASMPQPPEAATPPIAPARNAQKAYFALCSPDTPVPLRSGLPCAPTAQATMP